MKKIMHIMKSGSTEINEVPSHSIVSGKLNIKSRASLISSGTEKMLIEFGRSSLIGKAKAQPERIKEVIEKAKTDGVLSTIETILKKLDEPIALGYCNAGEVIFIQDRNKTIEINSNLDNALYKQGDRVASNGPHAEIISVPINLCAKIPENVSDEQATFTVLSSIGLQGIRLIAPVIGEKIVVFGMGLIGLVTVQMLRANGCEVMGIDVNQNRLTLAEKYGALTVNSMTEDPVAVANSWSNGKGVDGVIITASAKKDEILHQSALMNRKRGRILLVGVVDLNIRRSDFYEKELSFQVSCSYGPGRYDEKYEQAGQDYPYGFVRWTEQRNFEAVLQLMSDRKLVVDDLITHRIPFENALEAYEILTKDPDALGIILQYSDKVDLSNVINIPVVKTTKNVKPTVGIIGAGNFSKMTLMPALSKTSAKLEYISDINGDSAWYVANKYKVSKATTDYQTVLNDPEVNTVLIAVNHNLHAKMVIEALKVGKHVFVEKPLAMNIEELESIYQTVRKIGDLSLMVGFNRRFSPHIQKIKELIKTRTEPIAMNMTVNAGIIPPNHWVHDPIKGGGRIIGEACHFIDLMVFLSGSLVKTVASHRMGGKAAIQEDKMSISIGFEDGSIGTVNYFANGSKSYPKEMLEVFSEGKIIKLDNFRKTIGYGVKNFKKLKTSRQDKGHKDQFAAFVKSIDEGGVPLIPLPQLFNVTLASFAAVKSSHETRVVDINSEYGKIFSE